MKQQCRCALTEAACRTPDREAGPTWCPTKTHAQEIERALLLHSDPEVRKIAYEAARVEAEGYMRWTRVEEVAEFARRMGFRKLGIAMCIGLLEETKTLADILERKGFEVVSVCCKLGSVPKEFIGILDEEKVMPGGHESMCSPIAQAEILNAEGCELNIIMGLCVGHDSLFLKYAKGLSTVLVVKDRVLCHNTVAALYNSRAYYRRLRAGTDSAEGLSL